MPNETKGANSAQSADEKQNAARRSRLRNCFEWIKLRSSFTDWCVMIFTGVLAGAAIYQFTIMRATLDEMRVDRRPWMLPKEAHITVMEVGQPIRGEFIFSNMGRTPALDFKALGDLYVTTDPDADIPELAPLEEGGITDSIVGPGLEAHLLVHSKDAIQNQEQINLLKLPNARFYFYGNLTYGDPSNTAYLHPSQFCYYIVPDITGIFGCHGKRYSNTAY